VKDITFADLGRRRIDWAFQQMPVLRTIRKQFIKTQPLAGIRVAACMHVTAETANLMITLRDGGASMALGDGRLINLASGEGHPASAMDMSSANQAMAVEYILQNHATLDRKVYQLMGEIDRQIAGMKLDSMGIKIDRLTAEQEKCHASWSEGI